MVESLPVCADWIALHSVDLAQISRRIPIIFFWIRFSKLSKLQTR